MSAYGGLLRLMLGLLMLSLTPACSMHSAFNLPPATHPASRIAPQQFRFADGGHALFYTLEKSLSTAPSSKPATFLFFISGSGCSSLQYFLPDYFQGLEGASGPIRIFALQKRFIEAHSWGRVLGCAPEFVKSDHPKRWLADQTAFITRQLDLARDRDGLPERIVIAGVSEGAEIVPTLARTIPGVTHAVIIGNGGMDPLDVYRLQLQQHGLHAALADLQRLDGRPADPDADENKIAGRTWRYWDELRQLSYSENLLALTIPLWVAVGGSDDVIPQASVAYLKEQFMLRGKSNLVLNVYPGADHGLRTNSRTNRVDFWFNFDNIMAR